MKAGKRITDSIGNGMFLCFNFPLDIGVVDMRKTMLGSLSCHFNYEFTIFIFIYIYFLNIFYLFYSPPSA